MQARAERFARFRAEEKAQRRLALPLALTTLFAVGGLDSAVGQTATGDRPPWFGPAYRNMLMSPLPAEIQYAVGQIPGVIPSSTPFLGTTVLTHDPGKALLTGKCRDIGKTKVPQIRGLASRAPYFSNGSATTLGNLVDFYDRRFSMNLTPQERTDLINFLKAL
jgi:hypothetical protein